MLIEFLDLAGGRFFKAELLINFHPFHKVVALFGDKTISRRCTKGQFKHWNFLILSDNEFRDRKKEISK